MNDKYRGSHFHMSVAESADQLAVDKQSATEWCEITMRTNNERNGEITIRSKRMAEALRFMLGQMLDSD